MKRLTLILTLGGAMAAATALAPVTPLAAQGRGRNVDGVPPGQRPPPGMCRIWIDGVPPGRQPEPTDCATAVRNRPPNARVISGDDSPRPGKAKAKEKGKRNRVDDELDRRRGRDRDLDRDRDREHDDDDDDDDGGDDRRSDRGRVGARPDRLQSDRMPEMVGAVLLQQGIVTPDVQTWLGGDAYRASYVDRDGDGRPEEATWIGRAGQIVQVWTDRDRDGRADSVRIYEDGRMVREIRG